MVRTAAPQGGGPRRLSLDVDPYPSSLKISNDFCLQDASSPSRDTGALREPKAGNPEHGEIVGEYRDPASSIPRDLLVDQQPAELPGSLHAQGLDPVPRPRAAEDERAVDPLEVQVCTAVSFTHLTLLTIHAV